MSSILDSKKKAELNYRLSNDEFDVFNEMGFSITFAEEKRGRRLAYKYLKPPFHEKEVSRVRKAAREGSVQHYIYAHVQERIRFA